ncbi:hypothetical protein D3C84_292390 [compost metagenome]
MALGALADRRQHHAARVRLAQRGEQRLVVGGAGAAAVALQQQGLHAAGQQRLHVGGLQAGEQRQGGDIRRLAALAPGQGGRQLGSRLTVARAGDFGEGVEVLAAQLAGACAVQQMAGEVQVHAGGDAARQFGEGAEQVGPGIAAGHAGRLHGAGQQHRHAEAEQQKGQRRSAVGQGVGAVQQQHGVAAVLLDRGDDGIAHRQPVALGHVGAVDRRREFAEHPVRRRTLGMGCLLGTQARLEAGGRHQAVRAHLHADGAAGVEHQQLVGGVHGIDSWTRVNGRSGLSQHGRADGS